MGKLLKANTEVIDGMARQLRQVEQLLASVAKTADGYSDDLGSAELAEALSEFDDGWRVHREDLGRDVGDLAGTCERAAKSYGGSDRSLAEMLTHPEGPR